LTTIRIRDISDCNVGISELSLLKSHLLEHRSFQSDLFSGQDMLTVHLGSDR